MIFYAIKDWDKHFENSESRKVKSLTWVPVKNKHDGKGYRRVAAHPKSIQVFCAWNLIIQVASKMPVRGVLRDEDGPLTTSDLAFKTGFPEHIFEAAFELLTDQKIGWLERLELSQAEEKARASPEISGDAGRFSQNIRVEQNGMEGNRREQKGRELPPLKSLKEKGSGEKPNDGDCHEIPDEEQAVAMTMTAGVAENFTRYAYRQWAMQNGKNGNGIVVGWLPYVTNRWKNEQVEWKNGTHRGNRKTSGIRNPRLDGQSDDPEAKRASVAAAIAASEN